MKIEKLITKLTQETLPDRFGEEHFIVSREDAESKFIGSNYNKDTLEALFKVLGILNLRIPKDFDLTLYVEEGVLDIEFVHNDYGSGQEVDFPVPFDDDLNSSLAKIDWDAFRKSKNLEKITYE